MQVVFSHLILGYKKTKQNKTDYCNMSSLRLNFFSLLKIVGVVLLTGRNDSFQLKKLAESS